MSSPTKFQLCPLHTHTIYSVLDGAATIQQYLKWCVENGAPAMGITDHGWQIGNLEIVEAAKKLKKDGKGDVTGIPGCEFYVAPEAGHQFNKKPYDYFHVTVWAVNEKGYRNLIKLGSMSFAQDKLPGWRKVPNEDRYEQTMVNRVVKRFGSEKPRITFQELMDNNEGLIIGTGCLIGAMTKCFLQGEFGEAEKNLMKLLEVFKGRTFAEIMPHVCDHDYDRKTKSFVQNECTDFSPDGDLQKAANLKTIEMAKKHDIPLLLTVDSHFVNPNQKKLQDVLLQSGDPDGWRFYNSYHMMTTDQAWDHWSGRYGDDVEQRKIFTEGVESNHVIAELAKGLTIKDPFHQPTPEFPAEIQSLPVDEKMKRKAALLHWIDYHGRMKWGDPEWEARLNKELEVICDNGIIDFSDYFLFLEKVYRWTREQAILAAPGRGSGAGSLLCYLLKITHLDPFRFKLPFERFLSHARLKRAKFPDIDCDFGDREILLAWLENEYKEKFAQCTTHQTLKVKSSIKDACRVILGLNGNDQKVMDITATIPNTPQGVSDRDFLLGYKDAEGHEHQGHLEENTKLKTFFDQNPEVFETVMQLLGVPRAVGRHASAYFVSDEPISNSVPTCVVGDTVCTQYTAAANNNMVEKAGLIKFDFLRINTLSDISHCIRLIQKSMGFKVWTDKVTIGAKEFEVVRGELDITKLPIAPKAECDLDSGLILDIYDLPEAEGVFEDFDQGLTSSAFQVQTPLMTGYAKRIKPRKIFHGSDIVALVRPGPLEAYTEDGATTMTEAYIRRKNGEMPITYAHPGMEPILKDTYGVAVYQEQLQQMFIDLAGYSSEDADYLRETLAKKKKQEMEKQLPELRRRLVERGWTHAQQEVFIGLCISSSAYSFNRAHSASYAVVMYQCMFLKHFFPSQWWTAVLSNSKIEDIKEKGYADTVKDLLKVPHVNGPTDRFELDDEGFIHAPLYLIDGIGDVAAHAIKTEREKNGKYMSMQSFLERVPSRSANQTVMHQLILCGGFKDIEPGRTYKELIEEYHYLKKVMGLKIGEGKTGQALRDAVQAYKEKEIKANKGLLRDDIAELQRDELTLEILRIKSLPIYKLDVHRQFRSYLMSRGLMYSPDPKTLIETPTLRQGTNTLPIMRNKEDIERHFKTHGSNREFLCGFIGIVQDTNTFEYTDRKTKKKVTALKINMVNDGDSLEVVLWPDLFEAIGTPKDEQLYIAVGTVKPAREPGKWSMSTMRFERLSSS